MKEENYKSYTFALILYRDSSNYDYNEVIDYITTTYQKYAYIEHEPEGEEKKKHTHVLLHFDNKRYRTSLSKELGIPINYIVKANLKPYLRYLIHYDDEDKKQYTYDKVHGPLKIMLIDITKANSEEANFGEIVLYISQQERKITFHELTSYVLENGMYGAYRRNITAIKTLLKEHNELYLTYGGLEDGSF